MDEQTPINPLNPLVEKYGTAARWVVWKLETRNKKKTKVPYNPTTGSAASSTDSSTWTTYEEARAASPNVGIVFTPEQDLLGIDIDHCLDPVSHEITHAQKDAIEELLTISQTYTEISPSGDGLHLYFALSTPFPLTANRHAPYEVYSSGRYFTHTAVPFGPPHLVRTINTKDMEFLLSIIGYPWKKEEDETPPPADLIAAGSSTIAPSPIHNRLDTNEALLDRMFTASNGAAVQALYNGDLSSHDGDNSRADASLLSHFAFWTGKDPVRMESLWLASPLGRRTKTAKRADYRKRSISAAIARCKEVYTPHSPGLSSTPINDPSLALLYSVKDKIKTYYKNTENMTRILSRHPEFKDTLRFDEYHGTMERKIDGAFRPWRDQDAIELQTRISVLFSDFANIKKDMVFDAALKVAHDNAIDSGADYLNALVWDKTPRLDYWLHHAFHTDDDAYHRSVASNWLKGLMKRVLYPGCKFDYVLVLEGAQGIRKSTSLMTLAGPLGHIETTTSTENKDFFMQFLGNAIVEFSEGETLSRTEVKRMKAIITMQNDKFREPYGKAVMEHPRRCVFAMTTNQSEYLKDETGNRRWLPVAVHGNADTKWIEENREQLFAEAVFRVKAGETTYDFPEEEMKLQQSLRRVHDPNDERVIYWYASLLPSKRDQGITASQVFEEALNGGLVSRSITRMEEMSITDILSSVLMLEKQRGMLGGIRISRWYPTEASKNLLVTLQTEFVPSKDDW